MGEGGNSERKRGRPDQGFDFKPKKLALGDSGDPSPSNSDQEKIPVSKFVESQTDNRYGEAHAKPYEVTMVKLESSESTRSRGFWQIIICGKMELTNNNRTPATVFRYSKEDFNYTVQDSETMESNFDSALRTNWENCEENNVLRYKLNLKSKILEGRFQLLAQLNSDRALKRRKPMKCSSLNESFNPMEFNFTQLPDREIYFDIENDDGNNVIAVNVSPIEWGHSLFIPERFAQLPQKITRYSLTKVVELLLLSSSPNLRIVFNGLGAFASVNHLHWHLYYLKTRMPLESIALNKFVDPVSTLENFPSKGFCVQLLLIPDHDIFKLVNVTFAIIEQFQQNGVAHNVYLTRGKSNPDNETFDDVRIYIWARKTNYQLKDNMTFIPAVCELFGHLNVGTEETYDELTEEIVSDILEEETLETFLSVKETLRSVVAKQ